MRLFVMIIMILTFMMGVEAVSAADTVNKFSRGIVNIVSAPLEIPKEFRAHWIEGSTHTDHILVWLGCGSVYGFVQGIKRAASGTWDVLTFPFSIPEGYKPLVKPDYVFEEWPER